MNRVAVIDYGMGNLHSVSRAAAHAGAGLPGGVDVSVTADAGTIARADRVIFPGVGAIRDCMAEIRRLGIGEMVGAAVRTKPVLAICVGMQALMRRSAENGGVDCLGLMDGEVRHFGRELKDADGGRLKVPHIGWNRVRQSGGHPLWRDVPDGSHFYFVHSYHVRTEAAESVAGATRYGGEVVAAMADGNAFATQFHPEKSGRAGLTLLRNFLAWAGAR